MPDRIISILIMVFSVSYIAATMRIPKITVSSFVGIKEFPLFVGVSLFLASGVLFLKSLKERRKTNQSTARKGKIVFVTLAIVGYILILQWSGYIVATFLFLLTTLFVLNRGKWYLNVVIALGSSAVAYSLIKTLQITLPEGVFGLP